MDWKKFRRVFAEFGEKVDLMPRAHIRPMTLSLNPDSLKFEVCNE